MERIRERSTVRSLTDLREQAKSMTIPQAFLARVALTPKAVAVRQKEGGIYQEWTWERYGELVREVALGLHALGLRRGEAVAIMGDPSIEWLATDLAIQALGGISFGIYNTCSPEQIHYQMARTGARIFVSENQEYVDKLLQVSDRLPNLERIVVVDMRAMFLYDDPRIVSFEQLLEEGRRLHTDQPDIFEREVAVGHPDDVAIVVFTSGTTGPPKAAMITHRNFLVGGAVAFIEQHPWVAAEEQRIICHLPLAHAFERIFSAYTPILSRCVIHIGDSPEVLSETLFEVRPTLFHAVPRIWEKLAARILTGIDRSSAVKRFSHRLAMRLGTAYLQSRWERRRRPWFRLGYEVARLLSFRHILHKTGLDRVRWALTAGAHIPAAVQTFWQTLGVDLCNGLGMTEAAYVAFQPSGFPKPGSVGMPLPGLEYRLADDGELLIRGPGVFQGYLGEDDKMGKAVRDGWLHTGDVAELLPDGSLRLVDRKGDIMITAGGKNITPSEIENALKASPYISEAVVIADGRKYPTALIEIDFEMVAEWAREHGVTYTGYTGLTQHPRVYALIAEEVAKANSRLARVEQVKQFRIIPKELDPEEGDTTPTRKVKRNHFYQLFKDLIEEMYLGDETARIEAEVSMSLR